MNQTQYDNWVFMQLEPDQVIRTGNHKRYKPSNIMAAVAPEVRDLMKRKEIEYKYWGGEGAESSEEMEGDTEQSI